jgi:hypothetical protein
MLNPAEPEVMLGPVRTGLGKAGRSADELDVAPVVPTAIHEDLGEARNLARPWLAFYLGAMGAKSKNFYVELADRYGHGDAARECQDLALAGDRVGAAMALSDELIDCACLCATPGTLDDRLAAYESAGVSTLVAVPCGDRPAVVRALAGARTGQPVG